MGQGHLPVEEGVVDCGHLFVLPRAVHVLLVEEDTLHSCKQQTLLGMAVVGGCAKAQGCTGETGHMPDPHISL